MQIAPEALLTSPLRFLLLLFSLQFSKFPPELLLLLPDSLLGHLQPKLLLPLLFLLPLPFLLESLFPQAEKNPTGWSGKWQQTLGHPVRRANRQCPHWRLCSYRPQGASHSDGAWVSKGRLSKEQTQEHNWPGARSLKFHHTALCSGHQVPRASISILTR